MIGESARIFVAGHDRMICPSLLERLKAAGLTNIITRSPEQLDLMDRNDVRNFFLEEEPEYVFLLTTNEGGILANINYPADLIHNNLQIQLNLIHFAWEARVKGLLFLGSSCVYPKLCPQPMKEEHLLAGPLEPTNESYAIAKIAGIKTCEAYRRQYGANFISIIPANAYGPGDNFDLETSHVIPALSRKFSTARASLQAGEEARVTIWGTGTPRREFLYVDDLADACIFLLSNYNQGGPINVGSGEHTSIRELALMIKEVTGFDGQMLFDETKPDGMPNKVLDTTKMAALKWRPKTDLRIGLKRTYEWFRRSGAGT
jgi:GDP-L-fucose synthase